MQYLNLSPVATTLIFVSIAGVQLSCTGQSMQEPLQIRVGSQAIYSPVLSIAGLKAPLPYITTVKLLIDGRSVPIELHEATGGVWQTDLDGANVESLFHHAAYSSNRSTGMLEIVSKNDKGRRETTSVPVELTISPEQTKTAYLSIIDDPSLHK